MKKFCPRCGREDVDFYQGFCIDCYMQLNVKIKYPDKIVIKKCPSCDRWRYKKEWHEPSYKLLKKIVSPKVKSNLYSYSVDPEIRDDKTILITVRGYIDSSRNYKVERSKEVRLEYENMMCDVCFKTRAKAYEAKLQLRRADPFDIRKYKAIEKFVKNKANRMSFKNPEARAFWFEENKDGLDFFFGFREVADEVIRRLRDKYKVKVLKTAKLVGYDAHKGKKKYKATYVVRV